jgi:hypothetical protein
MKFRSVLGIKTARKCHLLKMRYVTVDKRVYFHQILVLHVVKKLDQDRLQLFV